MILKETFTAWLTGIKALKARLAKAEAERDAAVAELNALKAERSEAEPVEQEIGAEFVEFEPSGNK